MEPIEPLSDRHLRLLTRALELASDGTLIERLCASTLPLLGMSGAVVALMSNQGDSEAVAAAGEGTAGVFDLQFRLGEGPSHDAFDGARDVLVPDLAAEGPGRWPMFTADAHDAGVRAVFALPAHAGAIRLGALYLQRDETGPLSRERLADARVLTNACTLLLLDAKAGVSSGEIPMELAMGWPQRAVVHQATGMISVQLDCGLADALARLRARAFAAGVPIEEIATEVVTRRIRFQP